jgi:hypothetical protein
MNSPTLNDRQSKGLANKAAAEKWGDVLHGSGSKAHRAQVLDEVFGAA